jgi:hypothetical protein
LKLYELFRRGYRRNKVINEIRIDRSAAEKGDKLMKVSDRSKHSNNMTRTVAKTTSAKAKDIARSTSKNLRNNKQDTFASAKDTTQLSYAQMQKNIKQGWNKTRAWLAVGVAIVITFAQKSMRKAQKNIETAQKNLQKMQGPLQSNVRSGLTKTSDVIGKSTSKAVSGFQQATTRAKELQDSWQEQSAQRQRKRKRAKTVFRWGLIFGVALALLYSPIAGSEMRQRFGKGCQQSVAFFRSWNRNVGLPA